MRERQDCASATAATYVAYVFLSPYSLYFQKIQLELTEKHKVFLKAKAAAEKVIEEKPSDSNVQNLANEIKELEKLWDETTAVSIIILRTLLKKFKYSPEN